MQGLQMEIYAYVIQLPNRITLSWILKKNVTGHINVKDYTEEMWAWLSYVENTNNVFVVSNVRANLLKKKYLVRPKCHLANWLYDLSVTLVCDKSLICFKTLTGANSAAEQDLINDLLKGYNKDAHPIPEQNKSLYMVTFGLELVQLVNVVSKPKEIMSMWIKYSCSLVVHDLAGS